MGVEGMTDLLPGALRKRPSSEGPQNYFRNVEAEGSNPFTSTPYLGGPRRRPRISWAFVLCVRPSIKDAEVHPLCRFRQPRVVSGPLPPEVDGAWIGAIKRG